jgi:hypothetical protein
VRFVPSETAIRERLFSEARLYAEKVNVADYVADQIEFMRTGKLDIRRNPGSLDLGRVARAAQRIVEAVWEDSSDRLLFMPTWRLVENTRHIARQIS